MFRVITNYMFKSNSVDAATLLPVDVLGTEYVIPAWPTSSDGYGSMICKYHAMQMSEGVLFNVNE